MEKMGWNEEGPTLNSGGAKREPQGGGRQLVPSPGGRRFGPLRQQGAAGSAPPAGGAPVRPPRQQEGPSIRPPDWRPPPRQSAPISSTLAGSRPASTLALALDARARETSAGEGTPAETPQVVIRLPIGHAQVLRCHKTTHVEAHVQVLRCHKMTYVEAHV
ncbi:hypothetical protein Taro_030752 [Colocasia esculenta]|uniref:Uncharacterized protein n=1 Tax=Colocasia esculenta TaxID=4460 RepID=A0A843VQ02_COLES|nr:hypothetical protein [Colocasia esculenta]